MCMVLEHLRHSSLDLSEHTLLTNRRLAQRTSERLGHKRVRQLVQRKGRSLTGAAHNASRGPGEADQMLALAAAGARPQLRCDTGGNKQLQAKGKRARTRRLGRLLIQQRKLAAEQVEHARVRL